MPLKATPARSSGGAASAPPAMMAAQPRAPMPPMSGPHKGLLVSRSATMGSSRASADGTMLKAYVSRYAVSSQSLVPNGLVERGQGDGAVKPRPEETGAEHGQPRGVSSEHLHAYPPVGMGWRRASVRAPCMPVPKKDCPTPHHFQVILPVFHPKPVSMAGKDSCSIAFRSPGTPTCPVDVLGEQPGSKPFLLDLARPTHCPASSPCRACCQRRATRAVLPCPTEAYGRTALRVVGLKAGLRVTVAWAAS